MKKLSKKESSQILGGTDGDTGSYETNTNRIKTCCIVEDNRGVVVNNNTEVGCICHCDPPTDK
jgi:hypothetical protein